MADTETTTEAPSEEYISKLGDMANALNALATDADELDQDDFAFAMRTLALKVTKVQRTAATARKRANGEAVRGAKPKSGGAK